MLRACRAALYAAVRTHPFPDPAARSNLSCVADALIVRVVVDIVPLAIPLELYPQCWAPISRNTHGIICGTVYQVYFCSGTWGYETVHRLGALQHTR